MATNAVSLQFLTLLDDILLEILAYLPPISVVLVCRRICRKMDELSRDRHLWIKFFNQTKSLLRQSIELELVGTSKFENTICRAEMLERVWTDEDALMTPAHFWRYSSSREIRSFGTAIAIMGDYVIFWQIHTYSERQRYVWVSVHDWNGPVAFQIDVALTFPSTGGYMDMDTGIFYIPFPSELGLEVVGFRVDIRDNQIVEAIRYTLPTRHRHARYLEPRNGFLCLYYGSPNDNSKIEIDIVDLERGTLFQLALGAPTLGVENPLLSGPLVTVTQTHLIYVTGRVTFAVFKRPTIDQGLRALSTGATLPAQEVIPLVPILTGRFPFRFLWLWVMPRSATSFMILGIHQGSFLNSFEPTVTLHAFSFNLSEGESSFEEVCSIDVPGVYRNLVLQNPPSTAQYALGILGVSRGHVDEENPRGRRRYSFALHINLTGSERGSNQCKMTLTEMQLAPVVDEEKEVAEYKCFDHFSGRVVLVVFSNISPSTEVVIDYLAG